MENSIQDLLLTMKKGYVYIMSNKKRTVLYIGVTSDLKTRVGEHKEGIGSEFTNKYKLKDLIYFEEFQDIDQAITREKQLKNWHRDWKWNLIKEHNPELIDLAEDWYTKEDIEEFIVNQDYM